MRAKVTAFVVVASLVPTSACGWLVPDEDVLQEEDHSYECARERAVALGEEIVRLLDADDLTTARGLADNAGDYVDFGCDKQIEG